MSDTLTAQRRTVTAFFDNRTDADTAIDRLVAAGIPRSNINLVPGADKGAGTSARTHSDDVGFWESLKELFLPEDDRATYAEGLRRGGYLVSVQTDSSHYDRALDILDDEGTVDLDQRSQSWRNEGWSGRFDAPPTSSTATAGLGAASTAAGSLGATSSNYGSTGSSAGSPATGAALTGTGSPTATNPTLGRGDIAGTRAAETLDTGREEVIPIAKEELRIGKREVSHGRIRVRSYVVETPVQEQVGLREEHVIVERRPVDRAVGSDATLFSDRVVEAEERAEEAVIAKEARVIEELVVRKEAEERTETVSDTVRRTEVEVEDERGRALGTPERKLG